MSDRKILVSNRNLQVETCTEADEELLQHIKSTILGTPGRIRYRLTRIENKLAHMKEIYFVLLRMRGHLLGSIGFNKRYIHCGKDSYKSWYIRYFYIHAPFRAKKQKKEKYRDPSRGSNMLRDAGLPYMSEPALLIPEEYDPKEKNLVYGYVESSNFRSLNMSAQSGSVTIRKFNTLIFTRIKLVSSENCRRLEKDEIESFTPVLKDFYKEYTFYTDENMFYDGNYFAYIKKGEILAGLQVHPEAWKIMELPGWTNKILLNIVPALPGVRKIFNPKDFRFLALEGFYYKQGQESLLQDLIESVCKHFNTHFALMWADNKSHLYETLVNNIDFGVIGKSFDRHEADVRVRFNNFSEEEQKLFYEKPCYISAYDSV